MNTKLTLRLDKALILSAKEHARQQGKSLSQIVADYFALLSTDSPPREKPLTPTVRALRGSLRDPSVEEADYHRYLEEKYL